MKKAIALDAKDNVATLLADVDRGDLVYISLGQEVKEFRMPEGIRFGHKFALKKIGKRENIIKYGEVIGRATQDIEEGCHTHIHNVESLRGRGDLR